MSPPPASCTCAPSPALPAGLLNGAKTVAQDACLYTEDLAFRLVNNTLSGDASVMVSFECGVRRVAAAASLACMRACVRSLRSCQPPSRASSRRLCIPLVTALPPSSQADQALRYYFGYSNLTDSKGNALVPSPDGTTQCDAELTAALLREVAGIDIASGLVLAWVSRPLASPPRRAVHARAGMRCLCSAACRLPPPLLCRLPPPLLTGTPLTLPAPLHSLPLSTPPPERGGRAAVDQRPAGGRQPAQDPVCQL